MTRKKKEVHPKEKIQAPPSEPVEAPPDAMVETPTADTSSHKHENFPIVGIGASAGGLNAFEAFFSGMPADTDPGMAFVLVQHLAPDHKSILGELIGRYTRMQVYEVEDGMTVQPNCVYIIPPNHDMAFLNGALQLLKPSTPRGQRLPIDFFFQSLAQDQRERAIGIIFSGTGSDGTLGIRAIKGEGGMVMVQNPESTEFDGMPRNAIATGLVDYELPPAEMPAQLIAYADHAFRKPFRAASLPMPKSEDVLKKIFTLLRDQTGHDFSLYKPGTIHRRIERRMAVQQIETMDGYIKYLQQAPREVEALFRDMLIGVTSFFRDPEAFKFLEGEVIPKIFDGKSAGDEIRIWSSGCSSGEEAYSLAILLAECQEALKQSFKIQVFATDIDNCAIATARVGLYPAGIAHDILSTRLARFFSIESGGSKYRINKNIRDMVIFADHDVLKDPPFHKLDLISCRNLLIYMGGKLQKNLFPLFHYALNPGGFLFLGTSETVGEFTDLFDALDRKSKLYQRKENIQIAYPERHKQRTAIGRIIPPVTAAITAIDKALPRAIEKAADLKDLAPREQTEKALLQIAPAGALVNGKGDILYLHGRTGLYLEPAQGEPAGSNILKMAREGLRLELTMALHKAVGTKEIVRCPGLLVKTNGGKTAVNLTVHPVTTATASSPEAPRYLVILEESSVSSIEAAAGQADRQAGADGPDAAEGVDADVRIAALEQELQAKEEYLQTSNEELESSAEELKSANEELQSMNEELQSSNEELETSKEELQSVNEELLTVNTELQTKVADLSRANDDTNNLLAGTGIGTIFVDHGLHIQRFTPPVTQIMNLIESDLGRPVIHIVSNLKGYDRLSADVKTVLDTLIPKAVEVQTTEGKWYLMRILPYRTTNNVIEGAVITFVEITQIKQMYVEITELERVQAELRESEQRYRSVVSALSEAVVLHARNGTILAWNPAAERIFGLSGEQIKERTTLDPRWQTIHEDGTPFTSETRPSQVVFRTGKPQSNIIMGIYKPDGALAWISINAVPIFNPGDPSPSSVVVSFSDITEHRRVEKEMRESEERFRSLMLATAQIVWTTDAAGNVAEDIPSWRAFTGQTVEQVRGERWAEALHPDDRQRTLAVWQRAVESHSPYEVEYRLRRHDGQYRGFAARGVPLLNVDGSVREWVGYCTDITERKQIEEDLRKANDQAHLAVVVRDAQDAITMQDLDGRMIAWNPGAVRMYGWSEAEALAMNVRDLIPEGLRDETLARVDQLSRAEILEPYRTQRITKDGAVVEVMMISTALLNEAGQVYAIATTERKMG